VVLPVSGSAVRWAKPKSCESISLYRLIVWGGSSCQLDLKRNNKGYSIYSDNGCGLIGVGYQLVSVRDVSLLWLSQVS
jgi:hypothetical protein